MSPDNVPIKDPCPQLVVGTEAYSAGEGALFNKTKPKYEYRILGLGRAMQEP